MNDIGFEVRTRPLRATDAVVATNWMLDEWSLPSFLAVPIESSIRGLIGEERLRGGCIEQLASDGRTWAIAAVGLSAFISDTEVARYLADPKPFPSLGLLERALGGESTVFLAPDRIGRANADGGLNQLTIYYGQTVKDPGDPRCRALLPASHKLHREVHGGYRMRSLLQDEWTANEQIFVYAGYKVLQRFAPGTPCPLGIGPLTASRTLVGLTSNEAAGQLPGTTASFLFEYRPPRLKLSAAERRLLTHAVAGLNDLDICGILALSPNTLKATWRQIYARFEARAPFVLRDVSARSEGPGRGGEKRRYVVAYVSEHLEELRPYAG
ncbi:MAG: hypothetical protein R3D57_13015 [Hyphomicrobiaceae bacterium]